jgi:hypothetical protein
MTSVTSENLIALTFGIVKSINFKERKLLEKLRVSTFKSIIAFKTGLKVN